MPSALITIANGSEEMETVIVADILRRANWHVVLASIDAIDVTASRGVRIHADALLNEVDSASFDVLVLPGGAAGAHALQSDPRILKIIRHFHQQERLIAAICAAPLVLQAAGILTNVPATCHPAVSDKLTCTSMRQERVVVSGHIITSRGPGTAIEFALRIVAEKSGAQAAAAVKDELVT